MNNTPGPFFKGAYESETAPVSQLVYMVSFVEINASVFEFDVTLTERRQDWSTKTRKINCEKLSHSDTMSK